MKKIILFIAVLFLLQGLQAQDIEYARKLLSKLSSKSLHGRGYVKNGDEKAAKYLAKQFKKEGVKSLDSAYFQTYSFPINTFPGKISIEIDGEKLKPGKDFVISSSSPSVNGQFKLVRLPDTITTDTGFIQSIKIYQNSGAFLVSNYSSRKLYGNTFKGIKGIIILSKESPAWHVSNGNEIQKTVWLKVNKLVISQQAAKIIISANSLFIDEYQTQNVISYVKGKTHPDRFIVFSGHYDHLGMMGNKTYFPGANDNGSGTAMVMDMARHYALEENQPEYSIVFMLFSGEEAGLYGSSYYAENPLFPLQQIRMLINLDMVGTGSEGVTIVNGKAYQDVMDTFNNINDSNNYLNEIKARGEACNSDHCPFYQKGVKSIFIYTRGKEHMEYHTIKDVDDDFPFTAYNGLFRLLTKYVEEIR